MVDTSYLAEAMRAAGFETQAALVEASGVSPGGVSRVLKRGSCTRATAEKLQAACGEHPIGPLFGPDDVGKPPEEDGEEASGSLADVPVPEIPVEVALRRFEGNACDTNGFVCRGCYYALVEELGALDAPPTRGACRLQHAWELDGGLIFYAGPEGAGQFGPGYEDD